MDDAPEVKPKKPRMINVFNKSRTASIHLGQGRKIPPQTSGRVPLALWEKKFKDLSWIVRAERGDVIE